MFKGINAAKWRGVLTLVFMAVNATTAYADAEGVAIRQDGKIVMYATLVGECGGSVKDDAGGKICCTMASKPACSEDGRCACFDQPECRSKCANDDSCDRLVHDACTAQRSNW